MECVNLGRSGLKVSRLCLGMMTYDSPQWRPRVLGETDARPFLQRALEVGINFFPMDFEIFERVKELASHRGVKPAQTALAWLLHKPGGVAPIIGASKMDHLEEAVSALDIRLSTEEIVYLEKRYQLHPVLGHS